jgi:hypothetical protein
MRADIPFKERLACTVKEAETVTGLGRTTLGRLVSEKKIETVNIGARVLIVVPSLLRLFGLDDDPPAAAADLNSHVKNTS